MPGVLAGVLADRSDLRAKRGQLLSRVKEKTAQQALDAIEIR